MKLISPWQFALIGGAGVVPLIREGEKCFLELHLIKFLERKKKIKRKTRM